MPKSKQMLVQILNNFFCPKSEQNHSVLGRFTKLDHFRYKGGHKKWSSLAFKQFYSDFRQRRNLNRLTIKLKSSVPNPNVDCNWVAKQLTLSPFLMNVFLLLCYKMYQLICNPIYPEKIAFFSFTKLLIGV